MKQFGQLGDPIEVGALKRAHPAQQVGALKTQLGHQEAVAGLAGLLKALVELSASVLSPNLHLKTLNPHIACDVEHLLLASAPTIYKPLNSRSFVLHGVSSFGMSGTNAHSLLDSRTQKAFSAAVTAATLYNVVRYTVKAHTWGTHIHSVHQSPLLGTSVAMDVWERSWSGAVCAYAANHRIGHIPIMPGTTYLQMVRVALASEYQGDTKLTDIRFLQPLFINDHTALYTRITRVPSLSYRRFSVEGNAERGEQWIEYASTVAQMLHSMEMHAATTLPRQTQWIDGVALYSQIGNDMRGDFRCVHKVAIDESGHSETRIITELRFVPMEATPTQVWLMDVLCIEFCVCTD